MKKRLSALLVLSMAVSLTACGGGSSSGSGSGASSETTPAVHIAGIQNATTQTGGATEAATTEEKVIDENKKRELVVSAATEGKSFVAWDPDVSMSSNCIPFALQVYETPFKLSPTGEIENMLATGYEWSEDDCHLTLHFRDDVYFSNGDPMTADDVVFSFENTAPSKSGKTLWTNYESTEKIGDYDVVIHLSSPNASLINTLAGRLSCIYDKKYYEQVDLKGYVENPIGSGPYKLVERVLADHQTYELNENYWNKEEGLPFYEKITLKYLSDSNTQMLALENGEIDVLLQASIGPFLKLGADAPITYDACQASSVLALQFNQNWGLTANEEFRKFLQYAINRDEINVGVYEGLAEVTDTYGPMLCTGCPEPGTYTPVPDYDPEKAKQMLKDMGYNGEEFILSCQSGTKAEQACVIIQGQMLNLGVNCTVKALDQASYSALQKLPEGWNTGMRSAPIPSMDLDSMRTNLSYDHKVANKAQYNPFQRSEELEDIFKKTMETADEEVRKELFAQATSYCNEHAYYIPLINEFTVIGYNKNVKGVHAYPMDGLIYYKEWY